MRSMIGMLWLCVCSVGCWASTTLVMDGSFSDWEGVPVAATDPAGDATGGFDLREVRVTSRGTMLFVRFDIGRTLNLQSGDRVDGTLRLDVGLADGRRLTVDFREREFLLDGAVAEGVGWQDLQFESGPTYASSEFEMRLDLGALGVGLGERVMIDFSGSDSLSSPIGHTLDEMAKEEDERAELSRHADADFRLASLNTLRGGLFEANRFLGLGRMIAAMDADIYAFQEEWESSEQQFPGLMRRIFAGSWDGEWSAHKVEGNVIVSRYPLTVLPVSDTRYAMALVDMGDSGSVIVVAVHFKCCGSIGSSEDAQRIEQVGRLLEDVGRIRSGEIALEREEDRWAPVIVIGDYNLVGSRSPLDLLLGAGMRDEMLMRTGKPSVTTWRALEQRAGSFPPGRLDLMTYTSAGLKVLRGFALDTSGLDADQLLEFDLREGDSGSSDHLMLVVDFAIDEVAR